MRINNWIKLVAGALLVWSIAAVPAAAAEENRGLVAPTHQRFDQPRARRGRQVGLLQQARRKADHAGQRGALQERAQVLSAEGLLKRFDKDGDGKLGPKEVRALLQAVRRRVSAARGTERPAAQVRRGQVPRRPGLHRSARAAAGRWAPAAMRAHAAFQPVRRPQAARKVRVLRRRCMAIIRRFDRNNDGRLGKQEKKAAVRFLDTCKKRILHERGTKGARVPQPKHRGYGCGRGRARQPSARHRSWD